MTSTLSMAAKDPERKAALAFLAVRGVGPGSCQRLREAFGSLAAALEAGPAAYLRLLRADAVRDHDAQPNLHARAEQMLTACERDGAEILFRSDARWPARLRDLGSHQPELIFVRGALDLTRRTAGVVGTRTPTETGLKVARGLGARLGSKGHVTVSGGAAGVDTAAHLGALEAGGPTWAVLGAGFANPFPKENVALFERIAERGALITEFPPAHEVKEGNFHRRNKLVAALAEALVVVEGDVDSGAMITANDAVKLQRTLLAVPGDVLSPQSKGPHQLLREGKARGCFESNDLLVALGEVVAQGGSPGWEPEARPVAPPPVQQPFDAALEPVFQALGPAPVHFDVLAGSVRWPAPALASALTQLELMGLCEQRPGKFFVRRSG